MHMKTIETGFDQLIHGLAIFAAVLFCLMGMMIIYQVTLRYLFNISPLWVNDAVEYILLTATFLGAAYVLKEEQHIEIDIAVNMLSAKNCYTVKAITSVLGSMVCLTVAWFGVITAIDNYVRKVAVYKAVELPKYLVMIPICIGSFLLAIQFVRRAYYYYSLKGMNMDQDAIETIPEKLSV